MSLGQKLAAYRRENDLTQQQLGNRLNLSAQAVSKWENDLSEPDIATLKQLADIYEVSLDELLDLSEDENEEEAEEESKSASQEETPRMIGVCRECGITVTEENFGEHKSVLLCRRCVEVREEKKRKEIENKKRAREEERAAQKRSVVDNRKAIVKRAKAALITAGIVTLFSLISIIITATGAVESTPESFTMAHYAEKFGTGGAIGLYIYTVYAIFAFTFCLFFDGGVRLGCVWGWTMGIKTPHLITTFDLDGLLWLIGMKLLFWFLGIIIALVAGIIGIFISLFIIAPFSFPHVLFVLRRDYVSGEKSDLLP